MGFRSSQDRINTKRNFFAAHVQRKTHITKYSDQIVHSYNRCYELMERALDRPSFKQIAEEVTNQMIGGTKVRASTPLGQIPEHKLNNPSEATQDHMILPNLSVKEDDLRAQRAKLNQPEYPSFKQRADAANMRLINAQARVQLNK